MMPLNSSSTSLTHETSVPLLVAGAASIASGSDWGGKTWELSLSSSLFLLLLGTCCYFLVAGFWLLLVLGSWFLVPGSRSCCCRGMSIAVFACWISVGPNSKKWVIESFATYGTPATKQS